MNELLSSLPMSGDRYNKTLTLLLDIHVVAETGDVPCFGLYDPCEGGDTRLNFGLRRLCERGA